jgi:hypothetical protein
MRRAILEHREVPRAITSIRQRTLLRCVTVRTTVRYVEHLVATRAGTL